MNYPIIKRSGSSYLQPTHSSYSDEYAQKVCSLYLSDEAHRSGDGKMRNYYRLHARQPHNVEMALAYDIRCPRCSGMLKQVGRMLDCHELGLYVCKNCEKV